MAPGLELGALLETVDRKSLSGHDQVNLMKARLRQISHLQAELFADMVAVASAEEPGTAPVEQFGFAADEVRAALSWTRRAAESQLSLAFDLVEALPQVWAALSTGVIDAPKARTIVYGLAGVDPETANRVADLVLERAHRQTTGQIAARLRHLIMQADPEATVETYRHALAERRLVVEANNDGTTSLFGLNLPAERALAAVERINLIAQATRVGDDSRSLDQLRADVLLDLLEGRPLADGGHTRRPVIDLRVDLTTLAGLDDNPAEIPGWGPVIADIARQVVAEQADAQWRVGVTHSQTGEVLWNGLTRRRPTAALARQVQTLHPTCVFPGCRRPAIASDLDHNRPWRDRGPTTGANLAPLCRHDHRVKDEGGWKLRQIRPGVYQWTSRLGHKYEVMSEAP